MNVALVDRVNHYIGNGVTIGVAYHWAAFDCSESANDACLAWLEWENSGRRLGPVKIKEFTNWRTSSLKPDGFDNSNLEGGFL